MKWLSLAFQKYATFSGRVTRKEYWLFMLYNLILAAVLSIPVVYSKHYSPIVTYNIVSIYILYIIIIPLISMTVRRLHDIGYSGWWLLISFIPTIGLILLAVFACLDSQVGENEYGLNPKGL